MGLACKETSNRVIGICLSLLKELVMASASATSPVEIVNWYNIILSKLISLFNPSMPMNVVMEKAEFWFPVFASATSVILMIFIGYLIIYLKPQLITIFGDGLSALHQQPM